MNKTGTMQPALQSQTERERTDRAMQEYLYKVKFKENLGFFEGYGDEKTELWTAATLAARLVSYSYLISSALGVIAEDAAQIAAAHRIDDERRKDAAEQREGGKNDE